jgi:hypothetical protein
MICVFIKILLILLKPYCLIEFIQYNVFSIADQEEVFKGIISAASHGYHKSKLTITGHIVVGNICYNSIDHYVKRS